MQTSSLRLFLLLPMIFVGLTGCGNDEPANVTSPNAAPLARLELSEDGLGDVLVGFPLGTVVGDITAVFGEPDLDTDWIPAEPNAFGSCPGEQMRAVGWGSLVVIFINDANDPLGERFYTYTYGYDYAENEGGVDPRNLGLTTPDGLGIGSTVAELRAVYGGNVAISGDAALDVWSFDVAGTAFRGLVSGEEDDDVLTLIELVPGCDEE
jgi:hypothetical protein